MEKNKQECSYQDLIHSPCLFQHNLFFHIFKVSFPKLVRLAYTFALRKHAKIHRSTETRTTLGTQWQVWNLATQIFALTEVVATPLIYNEQKSSGNFQLKTIKGIRNRTKLNCTARRQKYWDNPTPNIQRTTNNKILQEKYMENTNTARFIHCKCHLSCKMFLRTDKEWTLGTWKWCLYSSYNLTYLRESGFFAKAL